jgi:hypothetical protein
MAAFASNQAIKNSSRCVGNKFLLFAEIIRSHNSRQKW